MKKLTVSSALLILVVVCLLIRTLLTGVTVGTTTFGDASATISAFLQTVWPLALAAVGQHAATAWHDVNGDGIDDSQQTDVFGKPAAPKP